MEIKLLEVGGFIGCLESLRLPFKKEVRSFIESNYNSYVDYNDGCMIVYSDCYEITLDPKDLTLLQALIKRGDEHAKALRLINTTFKIKAPLFWWQEMDTYEIGVVNGCSESTMHTLKKEQLCQKDFEYPILDSWIEALQESIDEGFDDIDLLKNYLPSGYLQERVINFSYQTLRRIIKQREGHRLPQWEVFIDAVKELPLANELIFI